LYIKLREGVLLLKKRMISLLMALGIVVSTSVPVFADPQEAQLNSQLSQQQSELQKDKQALEELRSQREEIEQTIEMLDFDIEELMRELSDIKKQIEQKQKDIKAAEADIKKAEDDMKAEKELYNKRIRAMYINGVDGYLNILLDSKGFNDFFSRIEAVKRIAEADKKIIAELNVRKQEVTKKKEILDGENDKLLDLKGENNEKLSKLSKSKDEQADLIAALKAKEKKYAAEVAKEKAIINQTLKLIQEIRNGVPKFVPSRGAADYSQNAVVAYAANFLGTPYKWGGTTPSGFDCSGYMQYVYRHFGVSLPRVSGSQATVGTYVPRDQLQPGDLVFFKKAGRPVHHVGMYVGNNSYIHAPQSGDVVKISLLTRSDYYTARRVR
jgi:peptidoglycan DL-endopeptidase CwlO